MYGYGASTKCFAAYLDYGPKSEIPVLLEDPASAADTISSFAHGLVREYDKVVYARDEKNVGQIIRVYSSGRSALNDQPNLERIVDFCKELCYEPVVHVYSMVADPMSVHEPSRFFAPYREEREVYWLTSNPYQVRKIDYRWTNMGVYTKTVEKNGVIETVPFAEAKLVKTASVDGAEDLARFLFERYGLSEEDKEEILAVIREKTVEGFLAADDEGRQQFGEWVKERETGDCKPHKIVHIYYDRRGVRRRAARMAF